MCGIVGAVAQRDIAEILLEGLRRLEYRGYDSAGMAIVDASHHLHRLREVGKVKALSDAYSANPVSGGTGIAHTRWATHGEPVQKNAHPHTSGHIAVVHNGIIENHDVLRSMLIEKGYQFTSDTDTEVIAHLVHYELTKGGALLQAVQRAIPQLKGAYGTVIIDSRVTDCMVAARSGSPLVIGQGIGENFLASDPLALLPVTRRFIYLEEGDIAEITRNTIAIFDAKGQPVQRKAKDSEEHYEAAGKAGFRHYMQKEIFEQPLAIKNTLMNRLEGTNINLNELGEKAIETFKKVEHINIVACGTSYYAGMIARYWFEAIAGIPCEVEIASEFRYRHPAKRKNSLFITLSQSGETADTLAALQLAKSLDYLASLTICNVASSSLVRESDFALITKAGVEIGVASTKAMTTQLSLLLLLVGYFAKQKPETASHYDEIIDALHKLPARLEQFLSLDKAIANIANQFIDVQHALFLGRGEQFAVAMEGALKLKEISYIHAEAYAGGELKHGPIALIDGDIPVIISAPYNELLDKLKSNIEEVRARGGKLFIFTDDRCDVSAHENSQIICVPNAETVITPLLYIVPMQLLAYHVACVKGTDVDQPRNLAKSVTVE